MTNEERRAKVVKALDDYTTANTASPQAARAALIKEGIYTTDGQLRPEYGGPEIKHGEGRRKS